VEKHKLAMVCLHLHVNNESQMNYNFNCQLKELKSQQTITFFKHSDRSRSIVIYEFDDLQVYFKFNAISCSGCFAVCDC